MATITEDYVNFETAKLLVKKGLKYNNAEYESYYTFHGKVVYFKDKPTDLNIAPRFTLQMAMKWLREVYNIAIVITPSMFWGKYNISIYKKGNDYPIGFEGDSLVPSYEEACEAAIKYCLENLI